MESIAHDLMKWKARRSKKAMPAVFSITDENASAILNLFDNDLGAAIDFVNEQERAINAERAIQNVPADEGGR